MMKPLSMACHLLPSFLLPMFVSSSCCLRLRLRVAIICAAASIIIVSSASGSGSYGPGFSSSIVIIIPSQQQPLGSLIRATSCRNDNVPFEWVYAPIPCPSSALFIAIALSFDGIFWKQLVNIGMMYPHVIHRAGSCSSAMT